jgi:O-antigen/teichoic acid export membrane protein
VTVGRRLSWGLVDQVLSSATNFALTVFVARAAFGADFGAFAIVLTTYLLAAGVGQGVVSQPFAARYSAAAEPGARAAVAAATGAALAVGAVLGAACLAASIFTPGPLAGQLLVLGISMPGLLLQDAWRFIFVALGRPERAAVNDGAWALVQAAAFALLLSTGHGSPIALLIAWGLAAAAGAVLGCVQARGAPSPLSALAWARAERGVASGFVAQAVVIRGAGQLLYTFIALVAGLGASGTVRGAQVLFGPLTLMYQGLLLAAVPESVRKLRSSPAAFARFTRWVSVAATLTAVGWSAIVLTLPGWLGSQALGATWDGARPLLPAVAVQIVAVGISIGPQVGLRAKGAAGRCLRIDAVQALLLLAAGVAGARLQGGYGAAVGIAAATAAAAVVWWLGLETAGPVSRRGDVALDGRTRV